MRRVTAPDVQERIDSVTDNSVNLHAGKSHELLERRLRRLDQEWDIERVLEANAASLALLGVAAAVTGRRAGLLLSAAVLGFLLQHAVRGWCPPVPLLRRGGVRTRREIERERYALKVLRGDFDGNGEGPDKSPAFALRAVDR